MGRASCRTKTNEFGEGFLECNSLQEILPSHIYTFTSDCSIMKMFSGSLGLDLYCMQDWDFIPEKEFRQRMVQFKCAIFRVG